MKKFAAARKLSRIKEVRMPLRSMILAAFFLLGITAGYLAALRTGSVVEEELSAYLENFTALGGGVPPGAVLFFETLLRYLRSIVTVFIFGFSLIGVIFLPLLCALQAFFFSFSFFSFAAALGRGHFFAVSILFAARFFLLPLTLWFAAAAMEKSLSLLALSFGKGKRVQPIRYDTGYWSKCSIAFILAIISVMAELWLIPRFLLCFSSVI